MTDPMSPRTRVNTDSQCGHAPDEWRARITHLRDLHKLAEHGPSDDATQWQHARGKLTARERLDLLFDDGSFTEIEPLRRHHSSGFGLENNRLYTDGVVTGWGTVWGRTVFAYAHDFRIHGGSLGEAHAQKIHKVMDLALSTGAPLVSLNDGAGARIQEGISALAGYGGIFTRNVAASGVVPQISVILGPCAGGASYSPALTDFIFMVRGSAQMFLTGPDVVRTVTGASVTHDELGGADVHATRSGLAARIYDTEQECLDDVRYLLSLLPSNNREQPPRQDTTDPSDRRTGTLTDLVLTEPNRSYNMLDVIEEIVDDNDFFELFPTWATNVVCGFAHLAGHVVGSSRANPAPWPAPSTFTPRRRPHASCKPATPSTSR